MTFKKYFSFIYVLVILLTFFTVAFSCPVTQAEQRDIAVRDLSKKMSGKFGRGLVNITTGWMEMIRCTSEVKEERGALLGYTWGPLEGIAMTVLRTAGGVFETVLFFHPFPGQYAPLFESEFVFSKPVREKPPLELPALVE